MYASADAADNELGPIGCRILAGSALLARLTELNLSNNKLKDVGVKALASADLLALEDLSLSRTGGTQMTTR
jgi:Leucine-rich repeat (LRR) protein